MLDYFTLANAMAVKFMIAPSIAILAVSSVTLGRTWAANVVLSREEYAVIVVPVSLHAY